MFQDLAPRVYHNEFSNRPAQPEDTVLAFGTRQIICRIEDGQVSLPTLAELGLTSEQVQYLFAIDDRYYYLARVTPDPMPEDWDWERTGPIRRSMPREPQLFAIATGESLYRWYQANRFCGACGSTMEHSGRERALVCPHCGQTVYPRINPGIIVAITNGDRLLMTRYRNRPLTMRALVAGFNEIGETIEDTVRREVMEEVGLKVKNLQFYKSQPWTFSDSLLMGFYAELDGDDTITLQEDELAEADWYARSEIPGDYSPISLTGEMITKFRQGEKP